MLCVNFQNDLITETYVLDEQTFARFEFKVSFWWISFTNHNISQLISTTAILCQLFIQVYLDMFTSKVFRLWMILYKFFDETQSWEMAGEVSNHMALSVLFRWHIYDK